MLPSLNEYIKVSQVLGELPNAQMNKDLLLLHPLVIANPSFSDLTNWKGVTFVFKSKGGENKRMIASFTSFDYSFVCKMRVRTGILNETEFELRKIIIRKKDDTFLTIRDLDIEERSKYDFILGQFSSNTDFVFPDVTLQIDVEKTNTHGLLTATFSEQVVGFDANKLQLTNATAIATTVSNPAPFSYYFEIHPIANGLVSAKVPAGICTDLAGNFNNSSNTVSFIYDSVSPVVDLSTSPVLTLEKINSGLQLIVQFSEEVKNFDTSSFSIINASLSLNSQAGTTYIYDVTPSSEGLVSISLPAGSCQDLVGNPLEASNVISFTYDTTSPTVTIAPSPILSGSYINSEINVVVAFSEQVVGFDVSKLQLTNTSASLVSIDGNSYTFKLIPNGQGNVSVKVPANACSDIAGNLSAESNIVSAVYDSIQPTVSVIPYPTLSSSYINSEINVVVSFNESVTGFDVSKLQLTNASASLVSIAGNSHTFKITPNAQGPVSVQIPAGVCQDSAGNLNTESNLVSFTYDSIKPTVTITPSIPSGSYTNAEINAVIAFTESVTGFDASKLTLTNATASLISTDGNNYTFKILPSGQGSFSIKVPANVCQDSAGNLNTESNTISFIYDSVKPTATLSTSPVLTVAYTNAQIELTVAFSEQVMSFSASNFQVTNANISLKSQIGNTYKFNVVPSSEGAVSVSIPENTIKDLANNYLDASNTVSFIYDTTSPTASLAASPALSGSYTNSTVNVVVSFNEAVSSFDASNLTLTNATASLISTTGNNYTFKITPISEGSVSVKVNSGVCTDLAGNSNTASNVFSFTYDITPPTITLVSSPILTSSATNVYEKFTVTSTFNAEVPGSLNISPFDPNTVWTVSNGTISNFTKVSEKVYTFDVTPTAAGAGYVKVAANVYKDPAGNWNSESNLLSFNYVVLPDLIIPAGTTTYTLYYGKTVYNTPYEYKNVTVPSGCTLLFDNYATGESNWAQLIVRGTLTLNGIIKARTKEYLKTLSERTLSATNGYDNTSLVHTYSSVPSGGRGGSVVYQGTTYSGGVSTYGNGSGGAYTRVTSYSTCVFSAGGNDSVSQGGTSYTNAGGTVPSGIGSNSAQIWTFTSLSFNTKSSEGGAGGARGYWGSPIYIWAKNLVMSTSAKIDAGGQNGGKGGSCISLSANNVYPSSGGGGGAGGNGAPIIVQVGSSTTGFLNELNFSFYGGSAGSGGSKTPNSTIGTITTANGSAGTSGSAGSVTIKGKLNFRVFNGDLTTVRSASYTNASIPVGTVVKIKKYDKNTDKAGDYYLDAQGNIEKRTISNVSYDGTYTWIYFSSNLPVLPADPYPDYILEII